MISLECSFGACHGVQRGALPAKAMRPIDIVGVSGFP
jgi:hypothetical protein